MNTYHGIEVVPGIAVGKVSIVTRKKKPSRLETNLNPEQEWERLKSAIRITREQLLLCSKEVREQGSDSAAAIMEAYRMILIDEEFTEGLKTAVFHSRTDAENAISSVCDRFADMFTAMDVEYMRERAADMHEIAARVLTNLEVMSGKKEQKAENLTEPVILVADELTPGDILRFPKGMLSALITRKGSATSHAAILARSFGIPTIIQVPYNKEQLTDRMVVIVDTFQGEVIIDPDQESMESAGRRIHAVTEQRRILQEYRSKEILAEDGRRISVYANICDSSEVKSLEEKGADGIGLVRSEFIYMERKTYPSEEEQFHIYKNIVEGMKGKPVTIRTLDIGTDKIPSYFPENNEINPALGMRGIRFCIHHPVMFKTQLKALFRAAVYGELSIMYPFVSVVQEIGRIRELASEAAAELNEKGIPYRIPDQGIMVEVPSAVMNAERLAKEVDFFSVGTNDLYQYTFAFDRENNGFDMDFKMEYETVIDMIKMAADAAHKNGIRISVCGEMASDPELAGRIITAGVDALSVSPDQILQIKKTISEALNK